MKNGIAPQEKTMIRSDFKKTALLCAALTALGGMAAAQANNTLLFPYVIASGSAYTFVTVYENPNVARRDPLAQPGSFSVTYGVKPIGAGANEPCLPRREARMAATAAQGGMLQWEVGWRFNLPADFGDQWEYAMQNDGNGVPQGVVPGNHHGFMLVAYDQPGTQWARVHGEAVVVDTASGLVLSYAATSAPSAQADFAAQAGSEFASTWFPTPIAGTTWYVLPVGSRENMTPSAGGGLPGKIAAYTIPEEMGSFGRNGRFDSYLAEKTFTCFGVFGLPDLHPSAPVYGMGGWFTLKTVKPGSSYSATAPDQVRPSQVWKLVQSGEFGMAAATMQQLETIDHSGRGTP